MNDPARRLGAFALVWLSSVAMSLAEPSRLEMQAAQAEAAGRPQEAFLMYLQVLQALPEVGASAGELRVREAIVRLSTRLPVPPALPEAATRHLTRGLVLFKEATERGGWEEAAAELRRAVRAAPWHAPALYNLAVVQEKLDQHAAAAANLKLCLLAGQEATRAAQIQAKVYELELRAEKGARRRAEVARLRAGEASPATGRLGFQMAPVPAAELAALPLLSLSWAERVLEVFPWGTAAGAGLQPGDLLYDVDGPLSAQRTATEVLRTARPGQQLSLQLLRQGGPVELTVTAFDLVPTLRQACEEGQAAACGQLAELYARGDLGLSKDATRAVGLWEIACGEGSAAACGQMAAEYARGDHVPRDPARAALLARPACDKGTAIACNVLGTLYHSGSSVAKDLGQAAALFAKSCEGGYLTACSNLAAVKRAGEGTPRDPAAAAQLYQKACDGGYAAGCEVLGDMYASGEGVPRDSARARELFDKACQGGSAGACNDLGVMFKKGEDAPRDDRQAAALYEKACAAGVAVSCENLAALYTRGKGVRKDQAQAAQLLQKACDGGSASGCNSLGVRYLEGDGVPRDKARAAQLYRKACDGNDKFACSNLGAMHLRGTAVPKDAGLAAAFFRKACELGNQGACKSWNANQ